MQFRHFILALLLAGAADAAGKKPEGFGTDFDKLAEICDQDDLSPLDIAQGSLLAARFYSVGAPGLADNRDWFRRAATRGKASVAGLYLAVHGPSDDLAAVRGELETNRTKRVWLYEMVGTEKRFDWSIVNGKSWAPFTRVLPATEGCRTLAILCLRSRDPLVRRGGAFWGYWFADASYWSAMRRLAEADPDGVTRKIASKLLLRAPRPAPKTSGG
jgi:hypothetical protein